MRNPTLVFLVLTKQTDHLCMVEHPVRVDTDGIFVVCHALDGDGAISGILHLPFLIVCVLPLVNHEFVVGRHLFVLQRENIVGVSRALDDIDAVGNRT